MDNLTLNNLIAPQGAVACQASISHLATLEKQMADLRKQHLLAEEFTLEEFSNFNFKPSNEGFEARSLILLAYPHYPTRFRFIYKGMEKSYLVPPTYLHGRKSDERISKPIAAYLKQQGFQLKMAAIPKKLTAVSAGLAEYGKNNIVYVKGMGSFIRLAAYISDLPTEEGSWREPVAMLRCEDCRACLNACPTHAIDSDRFLLHAERCITWWNEKPSDGDFPSWLKPEWHTCLVGCMLCQFICPENLPFIHQENEGLAFSEEETDWLISGKLLDAIPQSLQDKLNESGLAPYYEPRNFRILIESDR
jgi:epoxyqueuosine reductase